MIKLSIPLTVLLVNESWKAFLWVEILQSIIIADKTGITYLVGNIQCYIDDE